MIFAPSGRFFANWNAFPARLNAKASKDCANRIRGDSGLPRPARICFGLSAASTQPLSFRRKR